jgi:Ca2+-binding EF-hand superfamily protein
MESFRDHLFEELNTFRKNPSSLCKKLELGRIGLSRMSNAEAISRSLEQLIQTLQKMKPLPQYIFSPSLSRAAEKTLDLVQDNLHGAKGKDLESRVKSCCQGFSDVVCLADNGSEEPGDVITRLCLDKRDTKRMNPEVLLSTTYKYVGIAVRPYDGEDKLCSVIFADYAEELIVRRNKSRFTLTDWEMAELKKAFDLFDVEGLGKIHITDLKETFQKLGYDYGYENFYQFIAGLEKDSFVISHEGYLDFDSLISFIADKYADYFSKEGLKSIYQLFVDENRGKSISYNTFRKLTDELGYFFDEVTVKGLFQRISQNGRDITFNEFEDIMTSF